ncbi:transporter substrate-binding domain-containing protein [Serratia sp. M24T3]|uniref:transporter substrate-binding domain-containing protein n=1 Tax=Serratia sp. M24T3 TaxID=932213 RepID=UPI00025BA299|nr:transporter substrate-binding domain-containing protein [Serratia sp. M24T3]EIC86117.1 ABC transporter periplasmic substrate-binding protein [Serratia sp. M24T3]
MTRRLYLLCATLFIVCIGLINTARAETPDDIISRGEVRIGVDLSTAPFGSLDEKMQPAGLDVDMANLLAKDLGVKLVLVPITGQNRIPSLLTDKVDFIVASFGIYTERARTIAFSNPYGGHQSVIVAGPTHIIHALDDLKGLKVGVTRGTAHEKVLAAAHIPGMQLIRFEDDSTTLNALATGQVDAIGTVNYLAAELNLRYPDKHFENKLTYLKSFYGVGLRYGQPDLLHWINTVIFVHDQAGDLARIYEKWMKTPLPSLPTF